MDDLERKFLEPLGMTESQALEPAWLCALQRSASRSGRPSRGFTNAAELEAEVFSTATNGISVFELSILSLRAGRLAGEPRPLLRSLRPLLDPVPSPRHPVLAFRTGEGALKAMTLDGRKSADVTDKDVVCATWSADGCFLVYVVMRKSDKAGEICSRMVVGDTGELLENAPQAQTLALAIFAAGGSPRLCALPDGRILFAAVPLDLPARAASIQPGAQFFLLDPRLSGCGAAGRGDQGRNVAGGLERLYPQPRRAAGRGGGAGHGRGRRAGIGHGPGQDHLPASRGLEIAHDPGLAKPPRADLRRVALCHRRSAGADLLASGRAGPRPEHRSGRMRWSKAGWKGPRQGARRGPGDGRCSSSDPQMKGGITRVARKVGAAKIRPHGRAKLRPARLPSSWPRRRRPRPVPESSCAAPG